jgi:hypothetical protein
MTQHTRSTPGARRPRSRRRIGALVVVAAIGLPAALAPPASAGLLDGIPVMGALMGGSGGQGCDKNLNGLSSTASYALDAVNKGCPRAKTVKSKSHRVKRHHH